MVARWLVTGAALALTWFALQQYVSRRRQGNLLRAIVSSTANAIITTDDRGLVTSWNAGAEGLFGWRAQEALGRAVDTFVALDERQRVGRTMNRLRNHPEAWHSQIKGLRRDGSVVDLTVATSPVLDGYDVIGMAVIATDTTARNRAEAALREREHQLAEAQRLAGLGSWTWDVRADSIEWSEELYRIFGLAPGEVRLTYPAFLARVHGEDVRRVDDAVRTALDGTAEYSIDFRIVRADGVERWVHARGSVERTTAGDPVGMTGTVQDITAEVAATWELTAARDVALAANRAKSDFLATMSHEIRTPLNAVIGLTELLVDTPLDEDQRQLAEGVHAAGEALLNLVDGILDFSKIEAGRLELEVDDLDLRDLLEEVGELLAHPAHARRLELVVSCHPELALARRGDRDRLRQVLLNLASNAVKFTERGEVVIRARPEAAGEVRFEVRDTGIGIAANDVERLFEPFVQADASLTRRYGGAGLGLAISRRLVEAMGGRICVDSTPGEGSTFWFTVPLAPAAGLGVGASGVGFEARALS